MGAYSFVKASSHRIDGVGRWSSATLTLTHAVLCTASSMPGAGVRHTGIAHGNAGGTSHSALILNGDSSGTLCYKSSPAAEAAPGVLVNPNTNIIPPTDTWVILAITKASGTVAPTFYMWNSADGTWTVDTGSTTVANRSTGNVNQGIGSVGGAAADFWDGLIAVGAMWGRELTEGEIRSLAHGRRAWFAVGKGSQIYSNFWATIVDLTRSGTVRCEYSRDRTGTLVGGVTLAGANPPGW